MYLRFKLKILQLYIGGWIMKMMFNTYDLLMKLDMCRGASWIHKLTKRYWNHRYNIGEESCRLLDMLESNI